MTSPATSDRPRSFWRQAGDAFLGRGVYSEHVRCVVFSTVKGDPPEKVRAEFAAGLVQAHRQTFGTWPEPERVQAALVAFGVETEEGS